MFTKDHMGEQTPGDTYTIAEKPCRKKTPSEAEAMHPWLPQLWTGQKGEQQESEMAHKICKGYSVICESSFQHSAWHRSDMKPMVNEEWRRFFLLNLFMALYPLVTVD